VPGWVVWLRLPVAWLWVALHGIPTARRGVHRNRHAPHCGTGGNDSCGGRGGGAAAPVAAARANADPEEEDAEDDDVERPCEGGEEASGCGDYRCVVAVWTGAVVPSGGGAATCRAGGGSQSTSETVPSTAHAHDAGCAGVAGVARAVAGRGVPVHGSTTAGPNAVAGAAAEAIPTAAGHGGARDAVGVGGAAACSVVGPGSS
jgi:hypothetical protein